LEESGARIFQHIENILKPFVTTIIRIGHMIGH
jgi:hypothetical protein